MDNFYIKILHLMIPFVRVDELIFNHSIGSLLLSLDWCGDFACTTFRDCLHRPHGAARTNGQRALRLLRLSRRVRAQAFAHTFDAQTCNSPTLTDHRYEFPTIVTQFQASPAFPIHFNTFSITYHTCIISYNLLAQDGVSSSLGSN